MGLCKCPKRKVTNLFCFEHRVNVCEHCLTENHPRCVVQSYLNWLKDSDYNPSCALCNVSLLEGDVVRLMCYDIFHTDCLESHYRSLPPNTAPAGYKCYTCDSPIFPALNQAGRVVDILKETLAKFSWSRVGLGLPLIDEPPPSTKLDNSFDTTPQIDDLDDESLHGSTLPPPVTTSNSFATPDPPFTKPTKTLSDAYSSEETYWEQRKSHSVPLHSQQAQSTPAPVPKRDFMMPIDNEHHAGEGDVDVLGAVSRKAPFLSDSSYKKITLGVEDPDGPDKYKRRSALSWLRRWLKSRMLRGRGYHDSRMLPRRAAILLLIGLIAFLTFIVFATKAGRSNANDPAFDPMNNPNIHVANPPEIDLNDMGDHHLDIIDPLQAIQPAAAGG
uniref:Zinc finger protein-like 1 n=1 Tax=Phallusia mammillata TaxID=59560 RepID=A0A6F9DWW0_9ASCI|nr:ZF-like 1 zinc finger protein [Phallusia mammillata]